MHEQRRERHPSGAGDRLVQVTLETMSEPGTPQHHLASLAEKLYGGHGTKFAFVAEPAHPMTVSGKVSVDQLEQLYYRQIGEEQDGQVPEVALTDGMTYLLDADGASLGRPLTPEEIKRLVDSPGDYDALAELVMSDAVG